MWLRINALTRAVPIESLTSAMLVAVLAGAITLVVALVAKLKLMRGSGAEDGGVVSLVRFESPLQSVHAVRARR